MNTLFRRPGYPSQLWLLFWGNLAGSMGRSLVWPFLVIYIREQFDVALSTVTLLITLQSVMGFAATAVLGPLMDGFGRKRLMVAGLVGSGLAMLGMNFAASLLHWALLMPGYAVVNSAFRVGSYAMVADLVPPDERAEAYALLRMGNNVGIAVGPALGGFLVATAYALSYTIGAGVQFVLAVVAVTLLDETLTAGSPDDVTVASPQKSLGYAHLLRDRPFLGVWVLYVLVQIAATMVFVLLGVYIKENFGIPENRFGFIIGTNAIMVVLLQYAVTRAASRWPPLSVMAGGALFYGAGLGVFALSTSFGLFLAGMVVFTMGELLLVPTGTALAANLAPPNMRARYMGVFTLSFRLSAGIGPVIGGLLSDHIAPAASWYSGLIFCLMAAGGFLLLHRRPAFETVNQPAPVPDPGK